MGSCISRFEYWPMKMLISYDYSGTKNVMLGKLPLVLKEAYKWGSLPLNNRIDEDPNL